MRRKCACGCGQYAKENNKFISGHNNSFSGKKHTEEAKKKMSEARKNAAPVSDETKEKLSEAGKGRIVSEDTRNKMSMAVQGEKHRNWKGGIKQETSGRVFIRQGLRKYKARSRIVMEKKIGRILKSSEIVHHINGDPSDDRLCNLVILTRSTHIRGHNKGRILSPETKKKIGARKKGQLHSEESKKKISETLKKTWKRRKLNEN